MKKHFREFLELELIPLHLGLKVYTNSKNKTHVFRVLQSEKVIVQVPIATQELLNPKVKNLNITLQIGEGVSEDRNLLANAASAVAAYLKLYKDLSDSNGENADLDYYKSYFKLSRQKWLRETKN